jgi:hypothetical protein
MSDHSVKEQSGVWVQLPTEEVDLLTFDYIEREFSVLNGRYLFKFRKEKGIINELEVFMRRNNLFFAASFLKKMRIDSMEDLEDFEEHAHKLDNWDFSEEDQERLKSAIKKEVVERANNLMRRIAASERAISNYTIEMQKEVL